MQSRIVNLAAPLGKAAGRAARDGDFHGNFCKLFLQIAARVAGDGIPKALHSQWRCVVWFPSLFPRQGAPHAGAGVTRLQNHLIKSNSLLMRINGAALQFDDKGFQRKKQLWEEKIVSIAAEIRDLALAFVFRKSAKHRARGNSENPDCKDSAGSAPARASLLERIRRHEYPIDHEAK